MEAYIIILIFYIIYKFIVFIGKYVLYPLYKVIKSFLHKENKSSYSQTQIKSSTTKIAQPKSYEQFLNEIYLKKCYSEELLASLQNRKIKYLIHFTDIRNLESILQSGLKPRSEMVFGEFQYCDSQRLDNMENCISLSIEFPNQKFLWTLCNKNKENSYCIIRLNALKTLIDNNYKKYFFQTNAANSIYNNKHREYDKINHFEEMFSGKCLKPYLPRDVQAEILYEGIILRYCIDKIYFYNNKDYEFAVKHMSTECYNKNKDLFKVSEFYFKNRYGNIYWRDR